MEKEEFARQRREKEQGYDKDRRDRWDRHDKDQREQDDRHQKESRTREQEKGRSGASMDRGKDRGRKTREDPLHDSPWDKSDHAQDLHPANAGNRRDPERIKQAREQRAKERNEMNDRLKKIEGRAKTMKESWKSQAEKGKERQQEKDKGQERQQEHERDRQRDRDR